jgi:hypothetical protein
MALLSENLVKRLMHALTDQTLAKELVDAVNQHDQHLAQSPIQIPAAIVATNVSQTVDFAALKVNDRVLMIPATAGNADLITIAVAGDLGQAAVVGNIYLVLRAYTAPAASAIKL